MNKIQFFSDRIEITCPRGDAETLMLSGNIPYIHRNRNNTKFITTIKNIDLVLRVFRGIEHDRWGTLPKSILKLLDTEIQRRIAHKTLLSLGPDANDDLLWPHQQLGRELAAINDRFGFFYDTRTGKTIMSLRIILDDIERNPHHKWLILCPLILIENAWLDDINKYFPSMSVVSLHHKLRSKRIKLFDTKANVYIMNLESFIDYSEYIYKLGVHGCFLDESSAMKSNSTKFSKAAVEFATHCKRWYLLSGSPAPNGLWEYYRQLQSIDYYGVHQSFNQFQNWFFDNISRNPQYSKLLVKPEREQELITLLGKYSLYVDKEDVLETPGRKFIEVSIKMPNELHDKYHQLRREMYMELGDNISILSPGTAATLNKLNQVSSGFIMDTEAAKRNKGRRIDNIEEEEEPETHLLSYYRFEELDKLLDKHEGEQIVIWANYREEFRVLQERLGTCARYIYGGTNIEYKNEAIKDFKAKRVQYLVANPASADKGLTLTNAHICIYFSMNYSYELWKQSKERIYGSIKSQPHECIYYILIAANTIDRAIYNTVKEKGDMSMAVLEHLKGGL